MVLASAPAAYGQGLPPDADTGLIMQSPAATQPSSRELSDREANPDRTTGYKIATAMIGRVGVVLIVTAVFYAFSSLLSRGLLPVFANPVGAVDPLLNASNGCRTGDCPCERARNRYVTEAAMT